MAGPALPPITLPAPVPAAQRSRGKWSELLSPAYRSRTLIVWVLWASAYLIANSLNNWMPTLYTTVYHLGLPQALRAASMTNVAQVIVVLICAMVIDRTGRKYWMMGAFGCGAVMLAVLAFGGTQEVSWVIVFSTLSYGLIGSIAAVVYLYTPEIYPTRMRAIGTGVATSWLRIASAIGPTLIGFMLGKGGVEFGVSDVCRCCRGGPGRCDPDDRDAQPASGGNFALTAGAGGRDPATPFQGWCRLVIATCAACA